MASAPAERKALVFDAGGVRFALRIGAVREIAALEGDPTGVAIRGADVAVVPLAAALGLPPGSLRFAVVTQGGRALALGVEALHGIIDLAEAEVFQLPARTLVPAPSPFAGAIVHRGVIALELSMGLDESTIARHRAADGDELLPERAHAAADAAEPDGPPPGPEIAFSRGGQLFAVPVQLVVRVVDAPRIVRVPLAPPAHLGLLYHERALHPVFDLPVLYRNGRPATGAATALIVEAGADAIAVAADEIVSCPRPGEKRVKRPRWDLLFASRDTSEGPGKS